MYVCNGKGKGKTDHPCGRYIRKQRKKIMKEIRKHGVRYVKYGSSDELSQAVGESGRNVFALCDKGFAEVILSEIDRESE